MSKVRCAYAGWRVQKLRLQRQDGGGLAAALYGGAGSELAAAFRGAARDKLAAALFLADRQEEKEIKCGSMDLRWNCGAVHWGDRN